MNHHLSKATAFLCLASPFFFTSCKKNHNSTPACTLAGVTYSTPNRLDNYIFNYDPHGDLISLTQTTGTFLELTRNFLRSGNQSIVTTIYDTQPNTPAEIDTVTTNVLGYITSINGKDYTGTGFEKHAIYTYDRFFHQQTYTFNSSPITYSIWQNGDLVKQYSGTDTTTYTYTNTPFSVADGSNIKYFIYYGAYDQKTMHLIRSKTFSNGDVTNYSYSFDANGNVTQTMINYYGLDSETYNFQYNCQ